MKDEKYKGYIIEFIDLNKVYLSIINEKRISIIINKTFRLPEYKKTKKEAFDYAKNYIDMYKNKMYVFNFYYDDIGYEADDFFYNTDDDREISQELIIANSKTEAIKKFKKIIESEWGSYKYVDIKSIKKT